MQTKKFFIVLVAGAALAGSLSLSGCSPSGAANGSGGAGGPVPVGVVTVANQTITVTTELAGRTSAYLVAEVRPQVGGILQKRAFVEGGNVSAGQLLYQIEPASYQAAYDSAKAALEKSEANLGSVRLKAERYKELVAINAVSKQDYDDAAAALKQAEADISASKAALASAQINLAFTRVTAPVSGHIGKSSVTVGALVTASQATALATVQQLDPIYVDVTQSTTEVLRLKHEMETGRIKGSSGNAANVKLILPDGSTYANTGKLQFSDVTVDASTDSVTLRAVFPNPKHDLLPGMYVHAVVEEGVSDHAITVPQQGVTHDASGSAVAMVVGAGNKVESRPLVTARAIGDRWLITSGLKEGDQLIVEGLQKIRPGAVVNPVPASTVPAGDAASKPASAQ